MSERYAGPENSDAGADPPRFRGKAEANGSVRANKFHPTCRGIGDGMYAMGTMRNTGSPSGDISGLLLVLELAPLHDLLDRDVLIILQFPGFVTAASIWGVRAGGNLSLLVMVCVNAVVCGLIAFGLLDCLVWVAVQNPPIELPSSVPPENGVLGNWRWATISRLP